MAFNSDYDDDNYNQPPRHRSRGRPAYDTRQSSQFLGDGGIGGGLYRTRSHGARPAPMINIYNDQIQDQQSRNNSPYRSPSRPASGGPQPMMYAPPIAQPIPFYQQAPPPPPVYPIPQYAPYPVADYRGRSPGRRGDELLEGVAAMAIRDQYARSRSRGRSDLSDSSEFLRWQRTQREREVDEATRKQIWEKDNELKQIRAQEEQKRMNREYEERQRDEADKAKADEMRLRDKLERDAAKKEELAKQVIEDFQRKEREAKEQQQRDYDEFKRKEKEKAEKEAAEKKAKKDEFETEMRRRLASIGYTPEQIDVLVDEEKSKKFRDSRNTGKNTTSTTTSTSLQVFESRAKAPTYAKIHRDYLEVDTLRYYDVPYQYDRVSFIPIQSSISIPFILPPRDIKN